MQRTRKKRKNTVFTAGFILFALCWLLQTLLSVGNWQIIFPAYPIAMCLLAIPTVIAVWMPTENPPSAKKKALTTAVVLLWRFPALLLSYKLVLLIDMMLLILLIIQICCAYSKPQGNGSLGLVWMAEALPLTAYIVMRSFEYEILNGDFWMLPLVAALMAGVAIVILFFRKRYRFWGKLGMFLLIFVLLFIAIRAYTVHLNYALSMDEPEAFEMTVIDKERNRGHGRRSRTSYYLTCEHESEELTVKVSWLEYQTYDIHDSYAMSYYQGAFGKPFYLSASYLR